MLSSRVKLTKDGRIGTKDSKTKDDQSDAWQEKIRHIKEYLKAYPDAPDAAKKKVELKELEAKVAGTKDESFEEYSKQYNTFSPAKKAAIKELMNLKWEEDRLSDALIRQPIDRRDGELIKKVADIRQKIKQMETKIKTMDSKTKDGITKISNVYLRKGFYATKLQRVMMHNDGTQENGDIIVKNNMTGQTFHFKANDPDSASSKFLEIEKAGNASYKEKLNKDSYYGITTGQEIGKHNGYKLSLHKLENDNWLVAQRRGETLRTNVGGSIDSAITKMKKIIDGYSTLIKSAEESGVTEDDVLPVGLHNDMLDEEFDAEELKKGIEVEQEHTSDPEIAKAIAKDHLSEIKDYYTRLAKMEAEAGVKDCEHDASPTGTKEEEARLKQMRVNLETARRQGDTQEVKDIQKAIKELEEKIRRETSE